MLTKRRKQDRAKIFRSKTILQLHLGWIASEEKPNFTRESLEACMGGSRQTANF